MDRGRRRRRRTHSPVKVTQSIMALMARLNHRNQTHFQSIILVLYDFSVPAIITIRSPRSSCCSSPSSRKSQRRWKCPTPQRRRQGGTRRDTERRQRSGIYYGFGLALSLARNPPIPEDAMSRQHCCMHAVVSEAMVQDFSINSLQACSCASLSTG